MWMIWIIIFIAIPVLLIAGAFSVIGSIFRRKREAPAFERRLTDLEIRVSRLERGGAGVSVQEGIAPQGETKKEEGVMPQPASAPVPATEWIEESLSKQAEPASMESHLGGNILTRVGIVALIFGLGFLFQYAYVNEWLGPTGWVVLGVIAGILLLSLGEYFHARYTLYAQALTGGGIGVLYLSIFAAYSLYSLISVFPAYAFMTLITVTGVVVAIRYNSLPLALIGIAGGFLTPILISTGKNNLAALFTYIAILDIGILAVSIFKQWRELNLAGLIGTFVIFMAWFDKFYTKDQLWQTEFFITAFFIIFSLSTIIYLVFRTAPVVTLDMLMMIGVPTVYFGVSWSLLDRDYHDFIGFFALALAVWYFILTYFGYQINKSDKNLVNSLGFIALVFVTIAVPLQISGEWITMTWALESLVLLTVGLLARNFHMRFFALLLLVLVGMRLLVYEFSTGNLLDYTILFNKRMFIFLLVVVLLSVMAYLYKRFLKDSVSQDKNAGAALLWCSQLILFFILNAELMTYWDKETWRLEQQIGNRARQETFVQNNQPHMLGVSAYSSTYTAQDRENLAAIKNRQNISLSIFWAVYGIIALAAGIALKQRYARMAAISLFGLVILKVFIVDMSTLTGFYRISSFIGLGVILITVGYVYQRNKEKILAFIK